MRKLITISVFVWFALAIALVYPYIIMPSYLKLSTNLPSSLPKINFTFPTIITWESLVQVMVSSKLAYELKNNKFKSFLQKNKNKIKVIVDISEQVAYVYNPKQRLFVDFIVSTGGPEPYKRMTPAIWQIGKKIDKGLSPLYGPRLLFLSRLVNGTFIPTTIALHGTNTPEILGTPRSLGCVYFNNKDILKIYPWLSTGEYVLTVN